MSIEQFFNKTIIVRRLKRSGDKSHHEATSTVDAGIQAPTGVYGTGVDQSLARSFKIYTDVDDDIKENDEIQDKDTGKVYVVKSVVKKDYALLEHLEILANEVADQ